MIPEISRNPYVGSSFTPEMVQSNDSVQLKSFEKLLQKSMENTTGSKTDDAKSEHRQKMEEAARQMEIQLVTMMFKTMEKTSSENGMLGGGKSAGMSHFKDLFFQQVAEEVVSSQGLGFAQSMINNYESNNLRS